MQSLHGGDVQSGGRRDELEMVGQLASQGVGKYVVTSTVDATHLADVASEPAVLDEAGQRGSVRTQLPCLRRHLNEQGNQ